MAGWKGEKARMDNNQDALSCSREQGWDRPMGQERCSEGLAAAFQCIRDTKTKDPQFSVPVPGWVLGEMNRTLAAGGGLAVRLRDS